MFRSILLGLGVVTGIALGFTPVDRVGAQNTTCSDRPIGDSSNACANTRFVTVNGGGGGINCIVFTDINRGCVPASGGGTLKFLRADGTWAVPPGTVSIGGVIPWAGATVPDGYLLTFGQQVSRTGFAQLFTALTFHATVSCTSGSPNVSVTIATTDRVPLGAPIEAPGCFSAGTTVSAKVSGTLGMSTNAVATTSVPIIIFPWGNGNASTTFNVPNLMGRTIVGRNNMDGAGSATLSSAYYGTSPNALNAAGGAQSQSLSTSNLPPYTPGGAVTGTVSVNISDPGHTHTYINQTALPGATGGGDFALNSIATTTNTGSSFTGITATASTAGMTFTGSAQGGSSSAFSQIQPSLTLEYIIKAFDPDATTTNISVGITTITGGSNNTILYDNGGVLGELPFATLPDMYAGTATLKVVRPSVIWPPEVAVTYGATTTFDMSTFRDAVVTLTGNITTMTLTNPTIGKSGSITFIQDGTGGRTTVWDSKFKFAGGTAPVLTTAANAVDILSYQCRTSTFCFAAMMNDVK